MGQLTASIGESPLELNNNVVLNIDPNKPVKQDLKQLLNWSLAQIREIYVPFRRRKGSPILTRSQFLRFIRLSRITSFHMYTTLTKTCSINVFEILSILVLGAYTSYIYKLQFLFNIFDMRLDRRLPYSQLMLMFKSMARGFCFLTGQEIPNNGLLDKYAHAMFLKADLNNDRYLQIGEIIGWLETSPEYLIFFKLFEPPMHGKQDYQVMSNFVPYTSSEVDEIIVRINKLYNNSKIQQGQYLPLRPVLRVRKTQSSHYEHALNQSVGHSNRSTFWKSTERNQANRDASKKNTAFSAMKQKSLHINSKQNAQFFPTILSKTSKHAPLKKYDHIIIIKGKTITKREVFQLREYFDDLSKGKSYIFIQDFIENFHNQKFSHMKSVAASLFNFLDKKQKGRVQFTDLVTKLYPNLSAKHLECIAIWSDEYSRNFNIDRNILASKPDEDKKKRVLPKSCITRLQELYRFFDTEHKGYVTIENLRQILGNACTEKEIAMLFQSSDKDKDGKLDLEEFSHVLLPSDLEIEGLKTLKNKYK